MRHMEQMRIMHGARSIFLGISPHVPHLHSGIRGGLYTTVRFRSWQFMRPSPTPALQVRKWFNDAPAASMEESQAVQDIIKEAPGNPVRNFRWPSPAVMEVEIKVRSVSPLPVHRRFHGSACHRLEVASLLTLQAASTACWLCRFKSGAAQSACGDSVPQARASVGSSAGQEGLEAGHVA